MLVQMLDINQREAMLPSSAGATYEFVAHCGLNIRPSYVLRFVMKKAQGIKVVCVLTSSLCGRANTTISHKCTSGAPVR